MIGSLATSAVSSSACAASRSTSGERRASPYFFGVVAQLFLDQRLQARLRFQRDVDARALFFELVALGVDLHFLQPRQLAQARFEDVVGLLLAELEALHQRRLRFVLGADDADHLVEIEIRDAQAFEQVQAALDLRQAVLQALASPCPGGSAATRRGSA